jgi:RNA polymerase sigma-70 factor (ECF subfamily)
MDDAELRRRLEGAHPECFGWALACCGRERDDAEEVLQMVYLAVLDGHARYDGRSSFRTWLFGVVRRTAASVRRRRWLRRALLVRNAHRVARPRAPEAADVEVARQEGDERLARALSDALARLSVRQRSLLQLVFYHDLTVDEAAAALGISAGSARTHYARGKTRLAALLARDGVSARAGVPERVGTWDHTPERAR